jgi:ADP-ribose pyrophosphatase YjhB (NUDIX family)
VTPSVLALTGFTYCPRCGRRELDAVSDKAVRCIGCGFYYYHNAAAAAAAIIETPKGIVFVRRACEPGRGLLDLPGGFVDYDEGAEQALARELREELGVEPSGFAYAGSFPNVYAYRGITYHTTDMFYRCRYETPDDFVLSDEATAIVFIPPGLIRPDEIAFESSRKVLRIVGLLRDI